MPRSVLVDIGPRLMALVTRAIGGIAVQTFAEVVPELLAELKALSAGLSRSPSRFIGANAQPGGLEQRSVVSPVTRRSGGNGLGGLMSKALAEGTGASGGYLVPV